MILHTCECECGKDSLAVVLSSKSQISQLIANLINHAQKININMLMDGSLIVENGQT